MSNTEHFTQNITALVQRMSQGNATRGIEIGQGSGQQPQIELVATNVQIPIGYPINPVIGSEERPNNANPSIPIIKPSRMEQPRVEQTVIEPPRIEPLGVEPPRFKQPRVEPLSVEPPRFEQSKVEPPRVESPRFEQLGMEPHYKKNDFLRESKPSK
jgi:hypothetical protein